MAALLFDFYGRLLLSPSLLVIKDKRSSKALRLRQPCPRPAFDGGHREENGGNDGLYPAKVR